ncbi:hypothetical protein BS17DRAFT_259769 [Gyrodon lividus]|nr:hypothetical protein BS17DRAFT_259769 [Gyrodon lividus]
MAIRALPCLILQFVPLLYMAYLSRRPGTFALRLMLLPVVVLSTFGVYFHLMCTQPEHKHYNWGQGLIAERITAKAIDLACWQEGMLKLGEVKPGVLRKADPSSHANEGPSDKSGISPYTTPPQPNFLPPWMYDPLEILLASRGLGWQFGIGIYVPKAHRPLERSSFLRATLASVFKKFIILDTVLSIIQLIQGGSSHGGTIFKADLPVPQRYIVSTVVHLATGTCVVACFEMIYDLFAMFSITVLSSTPEMWPPIMDDPWKSDSLHSFWAKRWHQLLRETFFVYGGFLGKWLGGNFGREIGTFIGSALFHEFTAWTLGGKPDWRIVMFFAGQTLLLLPEKMWNRFSGERVGGLYGRLWVYLCVLVFGQLFVDSYYRRGLGEVFRIPPAISPTRQLFIPLLERTGEMVGLCYH